MRQPGWRRQPKRGAYGPLIGGAGAGRALATVNRLCGLGLDAVIAAVRAIRFGDADLIVAGGVESMSRAPMVLPNAHAAFSRNTEIVDTTIGWRFINPLMESQYGIESMFETVENVAEEFCVSREDQDEFAARSQARAVAAQESGRLAKEITPIVIPQGKREPIVVQQDEHPRAGTTIEKLAGLPTPFRKGGTVTAGNASGVNDGAAALIIASEKAVNAYGLNPMVRIFGAAHVGVAQRIMGIGPAPAIQKLCLRFGAGVKDFDVVELNEAFAAQALAVLREVGIDDDAAHVNPNGGAIALGHPLGASGARLAGAAALELLVSRKQKALMTMCIGVGQGVAMTIEGGN